MPEQNPAFIHSPNTDHGREMASFSLGKLVWRFLREHRLRALLSGLAISFGVAIIITADLVGASLLEALLNADIEGAEITHGFVSEQFDLMISIVGYVLIAAAGFVVFNAFTMTISQRQQQIGVLRSLGMTRRQIMRLVLAEGLILALLGVAVGLLAGPLLGYGVIALLELFVGNILSFASTPAISATAVFQAIILGIGVTLVSIWWPARRASRVPPLVALQSTSLQATDGGVDTSQNRWLTGLGLVMLLSTAAFVLLAVPGNWADAPTNTLLTVGLIAIWLLGWWLCLPAIIRLAGRATRRLLTRWGANGRLIGDNLQRETNRVRLTIVTLALGLVMIVGMTGFMKFMMDELFGTSLNRITEKQTWAVFPFGLEGGVMSVVEADTMYISLEDVAAIETAVGDVATVAPTYFVFVPELSFLGDSYFSYVLDPDIPRQEKGYFEFSEGNWEDAWPYLQRGCGLLVTPVVAQRNDAELYDSLTITTPHGPLDCTIAGIGRPFMNASIINFAVSDYFDLTEPVGVALFPHDDVDGNEFNHRMEALGEQLPHLWPTSLVDYASVITSVSDLFAVSLNVLLLLIVVAAAFGVVNTMIMSVIERRSELGLLRAIGATRRQVKTILVGEATLMGLIGGFLGAAVGLGAVIILILAYGGRSWGILDMDLWAVTGRTLPSALRNSLVGLPLLPLVAGAAAWLPLNSLLRGNAIETLEARAEPAARPSRWAVWRRGSIRTRFVVGTAVLLGLTLWGLITFVGFHARQFMDDLAQETVEMLVQWNIKTAELNLPADADQLTLDDLSFAQFDAQSMLQMETLLDGMSDNGMSDFYIMDGNQTVLISRNEREIGSVKSVPLPDRLETAVTQTNNGRELTTLAPIQNDSGKILGAMSLTMRLDWIDAFLADLQRALWLAGGLILLLGIGVSWLVATPVARTARVLSAGARATGSGDFQPLPQKSTRWLTRHTSLKTRLTAVLIGILVLMVGGLQMVAIPLERQHVEASLQDAMLTGISWMGQAVSEFGLGPDNTMLGDLLNPTSLATALGTSSAGKMQELAEIMQNEHTAYAAMTDENGEVLLANELSLMGEQMETAVDTTLTETIWKNEPIWAIATPMLDSEQNQIGTLHVGIRRASIDEFIAESRRLFLLIGLIALLAGTILAQVIGGAVTSPVQQLVSKTRRIQQGDLTVQFDASGKDELTQLANAYNEMVVGLREREWLRDMFGRFVSQEVAEAIRTGQVKLEGESRVVSVLFCDIRGFTARSEKQTPAEMVALLNEYLPVVVNAAQRHEGTVNKFGGDSTLIIYGAPKLLQESAYQAVLTAVQMQQDLARLNQTLRQRQIDPIKIGVGISTGSVLAGAVGPPERQEYTVIGDTVNLASRIESLNKEYSDYGILVSGQTYDALGTRRNEFNLVDLGEIQIRGKAAPVRIWAIKL